MDLVGAWSSLRGQLDAHRPGSRSSTGPSRSSTVPVVLLTGFLGAGKSTLLVHLLQNPTGLRIRALVNDVGSLPFDPTLVGLSDEIQIELTNGCACCVATSDLADSLDSLVRSEDCDMIVIEASGAADPAVLAHVVHANQSLHLDRTVAVVRGEGLLSVSRHDPYEELIDRQMANSDCVIVSGCDALSDEETERVLCEVAARAPGRTIERSGRENPSSHVLMPDSVRGTHLPVGFSDGLPSELNAVTVHQTNMVSRVEFMEVLERSRPGLVRAKGRLSLDGGVVLIQVTPHSLDVTETSPGDTSITLITRDPSDADGLIQLLTN